MKTPDQLKNDVRNRRFVHKGNVISLMNNSKWNRFFDGLISREIVDPIVRMKYVRNPHIYGPSHVNWSEIKATGGFEHIEWIEFQAIHSVYRGRIADRALVNHRDAIIGWLQKRHIHFEETGDKIVVLGHKILPA